MDKYEIDSPEGVWKFLKSTGGEREKYINWINDIQDGNFINSRDFIELFLEANSDRKLNEVTDQEFAKVFNKNSFDGIHKTIINDLFDKLGDSTCLSDKYLVKNYLLHELADILGCQETKYFGYLINRGQFGGSTILKRINEKGYCEILTNQIVDGKDSEFIKCYCEKVFPTTESWNQDHTLFPLLDIIEHFNAPSDLEEIYKKIQNSTKDFRDKEVLYNKLFKCEHYHKILGDFLPELFNEMVKDKNNEQSLKKILSQTMIRFQKNAKEKNQGILSKFDPKTVESLLKRPDELPKVAEFPNLYLKNSQIFSIKSNEINFNFCRAFTKTFLEKYVNEVAESREVFIDLMVEELATAKNYNAFLEVGSNQEYNRVIIQNFVKYMQNLFDNNPSSLLCEVDSLDHSGRRTREGLVKKLGYNYASEDDCVTINFHSYSRHEDGVIRFGKDFEKFCMNKANIHVVDYLSSTASDAQIDHKTSRECLELLFGDEKIEQSDIDKSEGEKIESWLDKFKDKKIEKSGLDKFIGKIKSIKFDNDIENDIFCAARAFIILKNSGGYYTEQDFISIVTDIRAANLSEEDLSQIPTEKPGNFLSYMRKQKGCKINVQRNQEQVDEQRDEMQVDEERNQERADGQRRPRDYEQHNQEEASPRERERNAGTDDEEIIDTSRRHSSSSPSRRSRGQNNNGGRGGNGR